MLFRPNQAYVTCPTAYLCDESAASNVSMCIDGNQVCDGKVDCFEGDDEVKCGRLIQNVSVTRQTSCALNVYK